MIADIKRSGAQRTRGAASAREMRGANISRAATTIISLLLALRGVAAEIYRTLWNKRRKEHAMARGGERP